MNANLELDRHDEDILVVDDTPENLRVVIGLLKAAGYKVRGVPNGQLALQAVALQPPDLILLDIRMPGMDGFQVCEALQQQPASHNIPIIFLSALTDSTDKQRAFQVGGVDYITKPFQAQEVLARVATHLELARHRAALIRSRLLLENKAALIQSQALQLLNNTTSSASIDQGGQSEAVFSKQSPAEYLADVLIVDDSSDNLRLMTELLQNAGYKVRGAISGELALQAVAKQTPDLILMDILMPGINGYEVCAALHENPASREVPIIFLTQLSNIEDMMRAFKSGGVDYITKPVNDIELLARVGTHVRLRRMQQGLEQMVAMRAAQLHDSEERYRRIFESMEEGYILCDMRGVVLSVNPAMVRLLGYLEAEDLLGKNLGRDLYVNPEDLVKLKSTLACEPVSGFVTHLKHRDGSRITVDCNAHLVMDTEGTPCAIEATNRDVTERERARHEERRLNRALRLLADCSRAISHTSNESVMLSKLCRKIVDNAGYPFAWIGIVEQDSEQGIRVVAVAGGARYSPVAGLVGRVHDLATQDPALLAIRTQSTQISRDLSYAQAQPFWATTPECNNLHSCIALPLLSGSQVVGVLSIYGSEQEQFLREEAILLEQLAEAIALGMVAIRSEQARKEAEAALIKRDAMLHSLIEYSPVAMLVDAGGAINDHVELINRTLTELFGYTLEDVPTMDSWWEWTCPEKEYREAVRAEWRQRVSRAIATHSPMDPMEITLTCKDRTSRHVSLCLSSVSERSIVTLVDLTELHRYRHHLEQLVESRTRELASAVERAEAATRAKATFLANMSHEIRTPLNAIMGMTNLAMQRAHDSKLHEQLGKVKTASSHLLHVINDILDLSKIDADKMNLENTDFRLGDVVENLLTLVSQQAIDKGLTVETQIPASLSSRIFNGDPMRLGQILLNLTGNALKFTDHGKISISADIAEETAEQILIRWEVSDTGIGIAPEGQERLFTAFEQADNSMSRKYGGTGLGLVISQRLVRMMGGKIGIMSELGKGSTFWFTVSLSTVTAPVKESSPPDQESALLRLQARYAGSWILLAEDEPISREVACAFLDDAGLKVDVAEDGLQAVELARKKKYALILMDMQMPNLNGMEATRAIRADSPNAATPILSMTANAFDEDRQTCIEAGMNDHITKPVDPPLLYASLYKWLEKTT